MGDGVFDQVNVGVGLFRTVRGFGWAKVWAEMVWHGPGFGGFGFGFGLV